jgi:hypothetical protein
LGLMNLARHGHDNVNHATVLHSSYLLSLWERIEVRALTLTLSQRERER